MASGNLPDLVESATRCHSAPMPGHRTSIDSPKPKVYRHLSCPSPSESCVFKPSGHGDSVSANSNAHQSASVTDRETGKLSSVEDDRDKVFLPCKAKEVMTAGSSDESGMNSPRHAADDPPGGSVAAREQLLPRQELSPASQGPIPLIDVIYSPESSDEADDVYDEVPCATERISAEDLRARDEEIDACCPILEPSRPSAHRADSPPPRDAECELRRSVLRDQLSQMIQADASRDTIVSFIDAMDEEVNPMHDEDSSSNSSNDRADGDLAANNAPRRNENDVALAPTPPTRPTPPQDEEPLTRSAVVSGLRMASQCADDNCSERACIQGQAWLQMLDTGLTRSRMIDDPKVLLRAISAHADICSDHACAVPFCSFFVEWGGQYEFEGALHVLQRCYDVATYNFLSPPCHREAFHMLQDSALPIPDLGPLGPIEGRSYRINHHLDKFAPDNNLLATVPLLPAQYCTLHKMRRCQLQMLLKLRNASHDHVVFPLWVVQQPADLRLAYLLTDIGLSLASRMREVAPAGYSASTVWSLMTQIMAAVDFLHRKNIVYLAWTASSMCLHDPHMLVKLSNFSYAVTLEETIDEEDVEDTARMLPPHVAPPECYDGQVVELSDSWGLAVIMYQLATGRRVDYRYRHYTEAVGVEVRTLVPRLDGLMDNNMRSLAALCLQTRPDQRETVTNLSSYVFNVTQTLASLEE